MGLEPNQSCFFASPTHWPFSHVASSHSIHFTFHLLGVYFQVCQWGMFTVNLFLWRVVFFIIYNWGRIKTLSLLFSRNKVTTSFTSACIVLFQFELESLQTFLCIYNLDTFEKYLKQCPQFVNPPSKPQVIQIWEYEISHSAARGKAQPKANWYHIILWGSKGVYLWDNWGQDLLYDPRWLGWWWIKGTTKFPSEQGLIDSFVAPNLSDPGLYHCKRTRPESCY